MKVVDHYPIVVTAPERLAAIRDFYTQRLGFTVGFEATWFLLLPAGGAVFSASAISFLGSLSHNGYDNNVSQLLANVLGEFMRRPGKRSARAGARDRPVVGRCPALSATRRYSPAHHSRGGDRGVPCQHPGQPAGRNDGR